MRSLRMTGRFEINFDHIGQSNEMLIITLGVEASLGNM